MTKNPYHYVNCGLDYIYLLDGFVTKETAHGTGTAIEDADGLHRAIARSMVTSPRQIGGQEVRFLRSVLRLSQTALARTLGVERSAVARWESEPHKAITEMAQTALRLVYAAEEDTNSMIKQVMDLRRAEDDADAEKHHVEETERRMTLSSKNGWHRAA